MSILAGASCRLVWEPGRGGAATRRGRTVPLAAPPDLGGGPVYAVDYCPFVIATVSRHVSEPPADMRPDEIAAALELLREAVPTVPGAL